MTLAAQDLSRAMGADAVVRVVQGTGLGYNHMNFLSNVNAGGALSRWQCKPTKGTMSLR
jgi:hypothetical protein